MQFRVFAALDKPKSFYYFNCDEDGEPYLDSVQEKDDFEKCRNNIYDVKDLGVKKLSEMDDEWLENINKELW